MKRMSETQSVEKNVTLVKGHIPEDDIFWPFREIWDLG